MVTDPPAGIAFMGKGWDGNKGGRDKWIAWLSDTMKQCIRVLKPGAHAFVWAIPKTSHWTALALEDAGFEIRDVVTHIFGSGFPKSQDISKAIDGAKNIKRKKTNDPKWTNQTKSIFGGKSKRVLSEATSNEAKQYDGWGTALKPASEHWILVRKPMSHANIAKNVLKWGTGGINIDGGRIEGIPRTPGFKNPDPKGRPMQATGNDKKVGWENTQGRFPANFVLSHHEECNSDCHPDCAVRILDEQSGNRPNSFRKSPSYGKPENAQFRGVGNRGEILHNDSGGASRFFYCAKPSKSERNAGLGGMPEKKYMHDGRNKPIDNPYLRGETLRQNHHPTVKSLKLMGYLIKLITPQNGIVLDPFMGSGSTGCAAVKNGFKFFGIEREKEYFEIAKTRLGYNDPSQSLGLVKIKNG
jgi:site-specific DNA-methyltransferase (adenine-specific)